MKYLKKSKELENNKLSNILGPKINVKTNKKSKRLLRSYSNNARFKSRKNFVNSKYKNDINKSIDVLMHGMPSLQLTGKRSKSEKITSKLNEIKPVFDKILENDMNKIVRDMLKKYKGSTNSKSKSPKASNHINLNNINMNNQNKPLFESSINPLSPISLQGQNPNIQNLNILSGSSMFSPLSTNISKGGKGKNEGRKVSPQGNQQIGGPGNHGMQNYIGNNQNQNMQVYQQGLHGMQPQYVMQNMSNSLNPYQNQMNPNQQAYLNYNNQNNSLNQNQNPNQYNTNTNFVMLNSQSIEAKMLADLTNRKQLESMSKMNNLDMMQNIHSEIDRFNKGIPQLIKKVETTINKINENRVLDKDLHPILSFASKNAGQVIYLHLEEITSAIIDDLLMETVFDLEEMEHQEKQKKEKHQFAKFVGSYYDNVNMIMNFEKDISKKITDKDYNKSNKRFDDRKLAEEVKKQNLTKAEDSNKIIEYKNPFETELDEIRKNKLIKDNFSPEIINQNKDLYPSYSGRYSASIHPDLLINLNKYADNFKDYQETTGTFIIPKIFLFYDNFVNTNINIMFDQEIEKYLLAQIDKIAEEIYRSETLIK